jgi:hypothetical protein
VRKEATSAAPPGSRIGSIFQYQVCVHGFIVP